MTAATLTRRQNRAEKMKTGRQWFAGLPRLIQSGGRFWSGLKLIASLMLESISKSNLSSRIKIFSLFLPFPTPPFCSHLLVSCISSYWNFWQFHLKKSSAIHLPFKQKKYVLQQCKIFRKIHDCSPASIKSGFVFWSRRRKRNSKVAEIMRSESPGLKIIRLKKTRLKKKTCWRIMLDCSGKLNT